MARSCWACWYGRERMGRRAQRGRRSKLVPTWRPSIVSVVYARMRVCYGLQCDVRAAAEKDGRGLVGCFKSRFERTCLHCVA